MSDEKTATEEPADPQQEQPPAIGEEKPSVDSGAQTPTAFEQAAEEEPLSLAGEFWIFLKENKKWWMLPILIVLGLVTALAWFSGTGAAPFIYTMF